MHNNEKAYIFLDIDGVLATKECFNIDKSLWYDAWAYPFNENCVKVLNKILLKTEAEIILTSDWRRIFEIDEMDKIFIFNKVIKSPVNYTLDLNDRDKEIREYVTREKLSRFVIIDDSLLKGYKERLIRTDPEKGLQVEHLKRIIQLLK
ncbi:MAG TPA: HAD domain-containing protein [Bacteroidales bacterium]|nr:HAD domain-containing protein [Bacteroidales bacterium]